MIGSLLTRALTLVFGYAYPAYECFKVVELNRPEIEELRFWCQYWILVAVLTVSERIGDTFISWLPMYSEAKLAFFVYLWFPKTKGTKYVYETFFRPYIAKHETEIDRNLLELRTRAGDIVVLYWQKAATYGQTRIFDILQYVASQSPQQSSRPRPAQRQPPQQTRQVPAATAPGRQPAVPNPPPQPPTAPAGPTKSHPPEATKVAIPQMVTPPASSTQPSNSSGPTAASSSAETIGVDGEAMQVEVASAPPNDGSNPPPQETPMEEAIRVTRGRLRRRVAGAVAPQQATTSNSS